MAKLEGGCNVGGPTLSPELEFGECRFCEVQGRHNTMSTLALRRPKETYFDMLLECFNVFLATDSGSLICASCAWRLREARDFKQFVLRALCGLRRAAAAVELEVSLPRSLRIKPEPEDPSEPESAEPEPAEPEPAYHVSGVVIKSEPDIEIVEHELSRGTALKRDQGDIGMTDQMCDDGPTEPKQHRDDKDETTNMDTILPGMLYSDNIDQNLDVCSPEIADKKFLEEYYKSTPSEEEDAILDSLYEMPPKDLIDIDQESSFLDAGCGCKLACLEKFDRNEVLKTRLDCLEQDYYCYHNINHLHLMTLGVISATARIGLSNENREKSSKSNPVFWFRGFPVCKKFFLFAHALRNAKYERILKFFRKNGVESLSHGSKQVLMTKQQRTDLIAFINNFSEQNSLVLPGRSINNADLHILPSSMSRTCLYERYIKACKRNGTYPLSRPLWYKCWDNYCPDVAIGLNSDPCKTCEDFVAKLSAARSENDKKTCLRDAIDHLNDVQTQKSYYQNIIAQVIPGLMMNDMSLGHHKPCSYEGISHYSFDYLQQVHLPHNPDPTTPQGFLESYKVSLFGIAIEPLNKFVLYVIPEYVPTGTNLVISLLHHFFETFAVGETHVVCHASNPNKNILLIQYALWRVLSGLHKSFQLSFLPSGHSKFAPDVYFGLFKSTFRESHASCLADISKIAANSRSGSIACVIFASETGDSYVNHYDWEELFKAHSPPAIPNLHSYNHFKTDSQNPLAVMCSKSSPNDFTNMGKVDSTFACEMPNIITPQDLSLERRKYLYENIRKYVAPAFKDILCPAPIGLEVDTIDITEDCIDDFNQSGSNVENPQTDLIIISDPNDEENAPDDDSLLGEESKNNACSYCNEMGHINEIKRGIYVCTKRQLDSRQSKVAKKCEYCIPNDVYNSILDLKLKEVYMDNCKCKIDEITENNEVDRLDPKDVLVKDAQSNLEGSIAATENDEVDPLGLLETKEPATNIKEAPGSDILDPLGLLDRKEISGRGPTKKKPKCSYCGVQGHRNTVRHGFYQCRKRLKDIEEALKKTKD